MNAPPTETPRLLAFVYDDGPAAGAFLDRFVAARRREGARLIGFLQRDRERTDRARCDMELESLADGARLRISEDRGPDAVGCRLDRAALAEALARCEADLARGADWLIVNKFGKVEAEGAGFRPLIAQALASGLSVAMATPRVNLAAFRDFAGDLAREIDLRTQTPDPEANFQDG